MAQWVEHCREYELLTLNLAQNDTQVHDKGVSFSYLPLCKTTTILVNVVVNIIKSAY